MVPRTSCAKVKDDPRVLKRPAGDDEHAESSTPGIVDNRSRPKGRRALAAETLATLKLPNPAPACKVNPLGQGKGARKAAVADLPPPVDKAAADKKKQNSLYSAAYHRALKQGSSKEEAQQAGRTAKQKASG